MDADTRVEMRLDDGVELLGKYKGSGLQESPYLLRRPDGQVVQVSRLLYLIAGCLDSERHPGAGDRSPDEVAARVGASFGQEVTPENVVYLVDKKLRPAGLVADPAGRGVGGPPTKSNPLLALRLRLPVVPERLHRRVTKACEVLFWPPWIVATLVGLVITDAWLVLSQSENLGAGSRQVVFEPDLLLVITAILITSLAFHEIGHAAAARYSGATPGAMGIGVYLVWPVFYTDLTDAYRLDRRGRLRTDLGGVYFNVVFTIVMAAAAALTGYRPLLVVLVVLQMETARQFLPFVRLDGYYVVSDLAGVPNLFAYIQPVLVTLLRRGDEDTQLTARRKLDELNPRARRLIKGWVYLTAPVLVVNGVVFLFLAPRLAGSVWASGAAQLRGMTTADGHFDLVRYLDGVVALVLLALPLVGMAYVFTRLARRMSTNVATWWQARPLATATASVALLTLVALQVAVEWPDTFAEAVQKAQVAQAIEDGHDGTGNTAEVALPMTPAAEAAQVGPSDPPPESEPPGTEAPTTSGRGSGESHGTESSTTRPTVSSGSTGTARPSSAGGATTTTATKSSSAPSTTADDGLPTTGVQPGTQDVPRGNGNGNGGTPRPPQTTTTTTTRPPSTTTTTRPGSLIGEILDLIF